MSTDAESSATALSGEQGGAMRLPAAVLLRLARGFSCLFWGLPLSLLLFTGAVSFRLVLRVRLPAYVLGLLILFCGMWFLRRAPIPTRQWSRRIQQAFLVLLVQVYLSPFVHWWRLRPGVLYFSVNVLVLLVATMWGFLLVNQLASEVARVFGDRTFQVEAQLCGWISVLFLLIPTLVVLVRSVQTTFEWESASVVSLIVIPYLVPRWSVAMALLPFTLTMTSTWRAKETCLRALQRLSPSFYDSTPEPGADERSANRMRN